MTAVDKNIRIRLKEYRDSEKLTQQEMADRIRVTRDYISKIERGTMKVTFPVLAKYKKFCNADIDYVLTGIHMPESPFLPLFEKCPKERKSDLTQYILWAMKSNVENYFKDSSNELLYLQIINIAQNIKHISDKDKIFEHNIIYGLRNMNGKNRKNMAEKLGLSAQNYSDLECGNSKPDVLIAELLDKNYFINPNYLITGRIVDMSYLTYMWNMWNKDMQKDTMHFIQSGFKYMIEKKNY